MKPLVLFVILADPRTSGRAVEAVRMAVGIGTWQRVDVAVYLGGNAALIAAENVDDLVEADNLAQYAPILRDLGQPVYIDAGFKPGLTEAAFPIQALDTRGLAELAARSTYVLRF